MIEPKQPVAQVAVRVKENKYEGLACKKHSMTSTGEGPKLNVTFSFEMWLIDIIILIWNHFSVWACVNFTEAQLLRHEESLIRETRGLNN